ncbi:hypothetical protein PsorP6_013083 [Peronosclerospora sorghi]|uniref:Uncharacterized protein n=1 Tax=Peronosclerospora sorghi TaxID=230839 RepID=A0ACC0WJ33_9STRA|nr:hypothetical protein PsorP6_013083 [Peronosclerospora sorghi]
MGAIHWVTIWSIKKRVVIRPFMVPPKRLNLSKSLGDHESSSSASSSHDDEEQPQKEDKSSSEEGSDDEFEIPPGFERVQGSGSLTREQVLTNDVELWFFKLPKNLDASALANVTFKVDEDEADITPGTIVANVTAGEDKTRYRLQTEGRWLTDQLVNAMPLASDRARFVLGKPFARCFSLVLDHAEASSPIVPMKQEPAVAATSRVGEKRKKKHVSDKPKKSKKAKHQK